MVQLSMAEITNHHKPVDLEVGSCIMRSSPSTTGKDEGLSGGAAKRTNERIKRSAAPSEAKLSDRSGKSDGSIEDRGR